VGREIPGMGVVEFGQLDGYEFFIQGEPLSAFETGHSYHRFLLIAEIRRANTVPTFPKA
jgi:hypothetical protein